MLLNNQASVCHLTDTPEENGVMGLRSTGGALRVDIFNSSFVISSEQLSVQHLEVFNNGAQRERREICERAYNQDGTD